MTFDLAAEQAKQQALYEEVVAQFDAAKNAFIATATDPGSGFDIDDWLNLLPTPSLRLAAIDDINDPATYDANTAFPVVAPPPIIDPATIETISEGKYDSAYLEEIEQEIRTITANVIITVLPVALQDSYFNQGNIRRARKTRDDIDQIKNSMASRGFPSAPMAIGRAIGDRVGEWQKENYLYQNDTAKDRLSVAVEVYFSSVNDGIKIEELRSRVIMEYSKLYSRHNTMLVRYYEQLVNEKTAAAQLELDNLRNALHQSVTNIGTAHQDNKEEVDLPDTIFKRALVQLEDEFRNDKEVIERRGIAMKDICDSYSAWMTAAVGSLQSTVTAKHDVTAT